MYQEVSWCMNQNEVYQWPLSIIGCINVIYKSSDLLEAYLRYWYIAIYRYRNIEIYGYWNIEILKYLFIEKLKY